MKRNWLNFVVDVLTALVMLGILVTGLLLKFVIPAGQGGRLALWRLTKHEWGDVHFWLAVGALALMVVHVALHWAWFCAMVQRVFRPSQDGHRPGRGWVRNLAGAAVIVLLGLGMWVFVVVAKANVKPNEGGGHGGEARSESHGRGEGDGQGGRWGRGEGGGRGPGGGGANRGSTRPSTNPSHAEEDVRGSSTLADIARTRGIDIGKLKEKLGLPAGAPDNQRLSWLRRDYNLSMEQVRQAVDELSPVPKDP